MWERFVSIWNYPLVTLTSGAVIAVSQLVLIGLLLIIGLLASRWIERIVAGRLAKTHLQADAAHALQRILSPFTNTRARSSLKTRQTSYEKWI